MSKRINIYKIQCNKTGKYYIGSSKSNDIRVLKTQHNSFCKHNVKYISANEVVKNQDYTITILESFEYSLPSELYKQKWSYAIDDNCVNDTTRGDPVIALENRRRISRECNKKKYWETKNKSIVCI